MRDFRKNFSLTFLALPGILLFFVFNYVPLYGLLLPFKQYRFDLGLLGSPWAGWDNFQFLFRGDAVLRVTLNTILYNTAFIIIGTVVALCFAFMLFELSNKFVKAYQTVLFIPYFISWVVAGYAFRALLDMEYGIFNRFLDVLGMEPIMWYNEPQHWPVILIIASVWKGIGYGTVIYYAALMGIDSELFEAARIDGASRIRQVISISLPSIQPIIILIVILEIGKIFYSDFGLFYNVTLNSTLLYSTTDVIDTFVYRSLIDLGDLGMASAAGFYQSVCGFILVLLANFVVRMINKENSIF
ncbi:ABC transporter permease [Paenibacillus sp. J5C2022]|uniref:ABC transporter permease n=1 Tax=Paenibacillus sp. J5C2022 TaxID=2977129 RepID=UPI00397D6E93